MADGRTAVELNDFALRFPCLFSFTLECTRTNALVDMVHTIKNDAIAVVDNSLDF